MVNQGDAKFIISPKYAFTHRKEIGFNLVMVFSIILIFSISYFILRIILSPVKALKTGVIRVSDGKLDEELPVKNSDELGQLTQSFNIMINRLKEIISSKEQLLLDVSHELRTPLTRMKIAMEFLPDGKGKKSINEDVQELDTMLRSFWNPRVWIVKMVKSICRNVNWAIFWNKSRQITTLMKPRWYTQNPRKPFPDLWIACVSKWPSKTW